MAEDNTEIPFQEGDWLVDRNNPGQPGQFVRAQKVGSRVMVKIAFPGGSTTSRPLNALEALNSGEGNDIESRLKRRHFGTPRDLQRLITFEKLKGTLHEIVYSMEAAQIDFYPYQFKPVLKFINSPTERLIIADEVGLGKTIESTLIWTELQARRQAKRLLIICPKILTEKWKEELREKFLLDARIVDFRDLQAEVAELKRNGESHPFVLIASYTGLRPPKAELSLLNLPPEQDDEGAPKTRFLREIRHWNFNYPAFDLVIFDEAHYMRNAATTSFHLGEALVANDRTAALCVTATPVQNHNTDLHSLLRLIDSDFFETQAMFGDLLAANAPAVAALNVLSRVPLDLEQLEGPVEGMAQSDFIKDSPLFERFLVCLQQLGVTPDDKPLLAKAQDIGEKLNLMGSYVNRTRRVQIQEDRPVRRARVLEVEYNEHEAKLYRAILTLVRRKCEKDQRPFHVFRVLGLQLRAASCLPALAADLKDGRLGSLSGTKEELAELLSEGVSAEVTDDLGFGIDDDDELENEDFSSLLDFNYEANDSKFDQLAKMIRSMEPNEKLVIFAFYRGTLAYLRKRIRFDLEMDVASIHGGVDHDERWRELARFQEERGPRILLSSEVGSEGIDLQFCHNLVNYDLPWNPMRVEQRIGRIDRVGQKSKSLNIFNFKIRDTVEERLYQRLHQKLEIFASSLGDIENVIGEKIQELTIDLLSQTLTPEEENERIELTERALANQLTLSKELEESGDALVALSDYVQKKISEDRDKGRYLQAIELEDYLTDFFEREFRGCSIKHNTPSEGCLTLHLSSEAQRSLGDFIRNDRSLLARPLRQRQFSISFRRKIRERLSAEVKRNVHFINHLSPLIRWITERNQQDSSTFFNVSALQLEKKVLSEADLDLEPGYYCYRIERWTLKGLSSREVMAYGIKPLGDDALFEPGVSEKITQELLRHSTRWEDVSCDTDQLVRDQQAVAEELWDRFGEAIELFEAENQNAMNIRIRRASNRWDRLISASEKSIQTMRDNRRDPGRIRARESRLENERIRKAERIDELKVNGEIDPTQETVAAGIFEVLP